MITALRLCQWQHLAKKTELSPLFAIDDYEGTLDIHRQNHLNAFLETMGQVFLTTPSPPKKSSMHLIHIKCGNVI